jgi:DNA segregation ATPase FtsK/SpoIIIE, S-DNA-T family
LTDETRSNIPTRIAFKLASSAESVAILDDSEAEQLFGQGNFIYRSPDAAQLIRLQGVLVTDEEIKKLVDFESAQGESAFDANIQSQLESSSGPVEVSEEDEELVEKCLDVIRQEKSASTSLLQRRLRLGYTRAARIVDVLEQRGILGPGDGAKPRDILIPPDEWV